MTQVFSYTCPFCERPTTASAVDYGTQTAVFQVRGSKHHLECLYVVCPNPACNKYTLEVTLSGPNSKGWEKLKTWRLVPESHAKVFPDYVPQAVRDDYVEACAILELSPKASATLSRRCLQGMIRDFWGVSKPRLKDEIEAIKEFVEPLTWKAIDGVRTMGNIGAHMERDIDIIIDVDPGEAGRLIWLIEFLIKDWYVTRHDREETLRQIDETSTAKENSRIPSSLADASGSQPTTDAESGNATPSG